MNLPKILIIDDEPNILDALKRTLQKDYEILLAESGQKGLEILKETPHIQIILCDQRMPEMMGVEMLEKSISIQPHAVRLLLTGYSDIEAVIEAINRGHVYRYLTKPWENDQLKIEIKKACEYFYFDRAKDNFLMLISHELKTPLTTILSFTESYLRGIPQTDEEKKHFVGRIQEGAKRLEVLVNDTLDLVTAQTGKLALAKTPCHLKALIEETLLSIHDMLTQKKILLENNPYEDCILSVDEALFKKALTKILEYAIAASDEGGKIEIIIQLQGQRKRDLTVSITHGGEILSKAQQEKLFEPFLVVGDILTHQMGAGLALPISKSIINAHGGKLSVESSKSSGTLFQLILPFTKI